jgi:hypothetical protein
MARCAFWGSGPRPLPEGKPLDPHLVRFESYTADATASGNLAMPRRAAGKNTTEYSSG